MKIIGINLGKTQKGMLLNDGGVCLIDETGVTVLAEERFTRKKYAGGYEKSLNELLRRKKYTYEDIDLFVISSCCEMPVNQQAIQDLNLPMDKISIVPSHHLSHAYSAYFTSNYKEDSIIMVLDNEGNMLRNLDKEEYYNNWLEHMSYYIGTKEGRIIPLEVDMVSPERIGVGDAYRYFTHYLGFPSYVYAGKTMGLAPYGDSSKFDNIHIFDFEDGHIKCNIKQNYFEPKKAVDDFFMQNGIKLQGARTPIDDITQENADLAHLVQDELERIIIKKVEYLIQQTGIYNLCIAGGVGLNSVMNGKLLKKTKIKKLHVVPAAGDTGQCLGNALYGYYHIKNNNKYISFENAYLGLQYEANEIQQAISNRENIVYRLYEDMKEKNQYIASLLAEGKIIARFVGRGEYGPRALGNRSILMDPRKAENKDILNARVKFRESFRPFAPSVLKEYQQEYFDLEVESPYMLLVADVKKPQEIPAVTHVDNSARIQTVSEKDNFEYYNLIEEFYKITGVPVLLNTSFNLSGEPIVESPLDAVECFLKSNIDVLILEKFLVLKK